MYVPDGALLQVGTQENLETLQLHVTLLSRHFNFQVHLAFSPHEAPPPALARRFLLDAFTPLFRAYASTPFGPRIMGPLLEATIQQLGPRICARLRQIAEANRPSSRRNRLQAAYEHEVVWSPRHGAERFEYLDGVEAAFQRRREQGGLVSLLQGRHVAEPEHEFSFDPRLAIQPLPVDMGPVSLGEIEQMLGAGVPGIPTHRPEAYDRALETLLHFLSDVQRAEMQRTGNRSFTTIGQDGHRYLIESKFIFSVRDLETDMQYCVNLENNQCPIFDQMLACKLLVEADLERFKRVANRRNSLGQVWRGSPDRDSLLPQWLSPRSAIQRLQNSP